MTSAAETIDFPAEGLERAPLRPSLLPMIDSQRGGCPAFLPSSGTDLLEVGQDRHFALKALLQGNETLVNLLPDDDREGVRWAADYVRAHAPYMDYPLELEVSGQNVVDGNFQLVFPNGGTPDVVCGSHVFDFKWRKRSYLAQMASYALIVLQRDIGGTSWNTVTAHAMYGCTQQAVPMVFDEDTAWSVLKPILQEYRDTSPPVPRTCEYCGWCARRLTCPAFFMPAAIVARNREDWGMQTYHISQITTPEDMATAIRLARHLQKVVDAVNFYKREWAIKQGVKIPGFVVKDEKGDREISDINEACRLSGIPVEKFVGCCNLTIGKLKEIWAAHYGISKAAADREINAKLASVIKREPGQVVVEEK